MNVFNKLVLIVRVCVCVSACLSVRAYERVKVCVRVKYMWMQKHKRLKRTLFNKTRQNANFQGGPLFQATNITKRNNEKNNVFAAGWEYSSGTKLVHIS